MRKETIEYYIVEHNPSLFAVMSKVTKDCVWGKNKTFTNYVGETDTRENAQRLIDILEELDA